MNQLLQTIFVSNQVEDDEGNSLPLHSHTKEKQCEFIEGIIADTKPTSTLEIGLAYGISTLAILDALSKLHQPFRHNVIDPYQSAWSNIGLSYIKKSGHSDKVTFWPKFSDEVLPKLYYENYKIQLAYIDSTKVFDVLLVDVYFITKILELNGILILDDCGFPGIRLLVRFLSQHPSYRIYKGFNKDKFSKKRTFAMAATYFIADHLPFKKQVLSNYNFAKDEVLGVDYHCIAFQKIKEDDRNWDWHRPF